jgi:hypothetical protein
MESLVKQKHRRLARSRFIFLQDKNGATRRSRTGDLLITNQLLYQLS